MLFFRADRWHFRAVADAAIWSDGFAHNVRRPLRLPAPAQTCQTISLDGASCSTSSWSPLLTFYSLTFARDPLTINGSSHSLLRPRTRWRRPPGRRDCRVVQRALGVVVGTSPDRGRARPAPRQGRSQHGCQQRVAQGRAQGVYSVRREQVWGIVRGRRADGALLWGFSQHLSGLSPSFP